WSPRGPGAGRCTTHRVRSPRDVRRARPRSSRRGCAPSGPPPQRAVRSPRLSAEKLASQNSRRQYQSMDNDSSPGSVEASGVGVLDKAATVLNALEAGPATLASLVATTGLARPTAHRLAVALEHHRLLTRDLQGRFVLGPRLGELAAAAGEDRLLAAAP